MLSNVTHSNFNFECNKERGCIDQLYIELGMHTLRSVNDVTEGSTQEAHMCASCVLPRKVGKMV